MNEAYRTRLVVKRRPDTDLEKFFMQLQHEQTRELMQSQIRMHYENIANMDTSQFEMIDEDDITEAHETYSVKPMRGRKLLVEINGEMWASARWLFFNLEYSIGFDSLTSWLSKYRGCVRRKRSPDGHVWLHHVEDFKGWRKKSINLHVRQEAIKTQIQESRL